MSDANKQSTIDEAELTAYALDELSAERRAAIDAALPTDAAAQRLLDEIRATAAELDGELRAELGAHTPGLDEARWQEIALAAARARRPAGKGRNSMLRAAAQSVRDAFGPTPTYHVLTRLPLERASATWMRAAAAAVVFVACLSGSMLLSIYQSSRQTAAVSPGSSNAGPALLSPPAPHFVFEAPAPPATSGIGEIGVGDGQLQDLVAAQAEPWNAPRPPGFDDARLRALLGVEARNESVKPQFGLGKPITGYGVAMVLHRRPGLKHAPPPAAFARRPAPVQHGGAVAGPNKPHIPTPIMPNPRSAMFSPSPEAPAHPAQPTSKPANKAKH